MCEHVLYGQLLDSQHKWGLGGNLELRIISWVLSGTMKMQWTYIHDISLVMNEVAVM